MEKNKKILVLCTTRNIPAIDQTIKLIIKINVTLKVTIKRARKAKNNTKHSIGYLHLG